MRQLSQLPSLTSVFLGHIVRWGKYPIQGIKKQSISNCIIKKRLCGFTVQSKNLTCKLDSVRVQNKKNSNMSKNTIYLVNDTLYLTINQEILQKYLR